MSAPYLYRGVWPQNVSKLAKYGVRLDAGEWKVTVLYDAGNGLRYLAVHGDGKDLAQAVNDVKIALGQPPGGAFYVNEYRHVIVPVGDGASSRYYCAGRLHLDLSFEYDGRELTGKPVGEDGTPLRPGQPWVGPRPGIPYVLTAGAGNIYYKTPALTEDEPPKLMPRTTRKVELSKILKDSSAAARAAAPVATVKGHQGGRFYVNEHGAIFCPVAAGDGNGLDYVYCGRLDLAAWFPEPRI